MMRRPKVFFDTNLLEPLSTPPLDSSLQRIRKHLSERYLYVVSPLTVNELLVGIKNGDAQYFAKDQAKMQVLRGTGGIRLLPPPGTHALKHALGKHVSPPTFSTAEIRKCIEIVLRSESRRQLEEGRVPMRLSCKMAGLNFELIEQLLESGKAEHTRLLELLRAKQLRRPLPEEWVKASFQHLNLELAQSEWRRLPAALESAFALNDFLCDQAEQNTYSFADHDSDWIDVQQLFYLSDPSIHFLTHDERLRNRVRGCGQAARIISFRDLLTELGISL